MAWQTLLTPRGTGDADIIHFLANCCGQQDLAEKRGAVMLAMILLLM